MQRSSESNLVSSSEEIIERSRPIFKSPYQNSKNYSLTSNFSSEALTVNSETVSVTKFVSFKRDYLIDKKNVCSNPFCSNVLESANLICLFCVVIS